MKKSFVSLLLCLIGTFSILPAQEAWLLEMPNKYSDYLLKKTLAEEYDTVTGIIEKIPNLIASKQIQELELVKWNADEGKINRKEKVTEGTSRYDAGARYYALTKDSLEHRKITISPASNTKRTFKLETYGVIPRSWTPTFIQKGPKFTLLLLERNLDANTETISLSHRVHFELQTGTTKNFITWYSSDSLDAKKLSYTKQKSHNTNPLLKFGTNLFSYINKDGDSLIRIEQHLLPDRKTSTIGLYHNEAKFQGHTETSGPLKEEIIKIADKSFTVGENKGKWTLTLTSGE